MRIGIFGGTFDPIHKGHIAVIKAAASSGCLDEIIVVPSAIPPHKALRTISFSAYRYQMVHIALEHETFDIPVSLSDIELKREGKSYTLDTIYELKSKYSSADKLVLIYGADILFDIEKWYKPDQIMRSCELLLFNRPGFSYDLVDDKISYLIEKYGAVISQLKAESIDISSTQLRDYLINNDENAIFYITSEIKQWIDRNALYSYTLEQNLISPNVFMMLIRYEQQLYNIISRNRIIHSLNTMREAVKLANLFGGDIDKSAIAALLHDCAKSVAICDAKISSLNKNVDYNEKTTSPDILHAYIGKQVAIENFGISDEDILNAIYYHTTSRIDSSLLEKIVFVADKIEPARTFPNIGEIRKIAHENLDAGLYECLSDIIKLLISIGKTPHPDSVKVYEELKLIYNHDL